MPAGEKWKLVFDSRIDGTKRRRNVKTVVEYRKGKQVLRLQMIEVKHWIAYLIKEDGSRVDLEVSGLNKQDIIKKLKVRGFQSE
jgi:hypothetical protein